MTISSRKR